MGTPFHQIADTSSTTTVAPAVDGSLSTFSFVTLIIVCVFLLAVFVLTPVLWRRCRPLGPLAPLFEVPCRRIQKPLLPTVGVESSHPSEIERIQFLLEKGREGRGRTGYI